MNSLSSMSGGCTRIAAFCIRCDRSGTKFSSIAFLLTMASALCVSNVQMASAQTETVLHAFKGGTDGSYPLETVLVRDPNGNLFGTTVKGGGAGCGSGGCGTVFKVFPTGQETVRYRFAGDADGSGPAAGVVQDGEGDLYGTTSKGGGTGCDGSGCGTAFKVSRTGSEEVIHRFVSGNDGAFPGQIVRDANGNIFGVTGGGGGVFNTTCGPQYCGTFFEITATGTEKVLWAFGNGSDGINPDGLLQTADEKFYVTTSYGGANGGGALFEMSPSGEEKIFYSFCFPSDCGGGSSPEAGMVQDSSGNFYGTTIWGGVHGVGTLFELKSSGEEKVLYSFAGPKGGPNPYPYDGVVRDSHGNLYGVTWQGGGSGCGGWGCGVVYEITATGEEKTLYRFIGGADGGNPSSGLVLDSDGNLYGTTYYGGDPSCYDGYNYGCGTVFKITP